MIFFLLCLAKPEVSAPPMLMRKVIAFYAFCTASTEVRCTWKMCIGWRTLKPTETCDFTLKVALCYASIA